MKIAAVVKIKHGEIWKALETLGWSQTELARQADMQPTRVGDIVNLKRRPSQNEVKKIELAFLTEGLIVDVIREWPELFTSRGKSMTYYKDIESDRLLSGSQSMSLENKEVVQMLFDKLSLLEVDIIMMNRVEGIPLAEVAGNTITQPQMYQGFRKSLIRRYMSLMKSLRSMEQLQGIP